MNTSDKIMKFLKRRKTMVSAKMISQKTDCNPKTVRNVLPNMEYAGLVTVEYMIDPLTKREVLGYGAG